MSTTTGYLNTLAGFFSATPEQVEQAELPPGMTVTENGSLAHNGTGLQDEEALLQNRLNGGKCLDLFIKLVRNINTQQLNDMFKDALNEDMLTTLKIVANTRDCRGGKGERSIVFKMLSHLKKYYPETYKLNLSYLTAELGRYKDLIDLACMTNGTDNTELNVFAEQIIKDLHDLQNGATTVSLAIKWLPRKDNNKTRAYKIASRLRNIILFKMSAQSNQHQFIDNNKKDEYYRKNVIQPLAKQVSVVETLMSSGEWDKIDFSKVPTLAMKRYAKKAFRTHCQEALNEYYSKVEAGEAKINTAVLTPYDCVHDVMSGKATEATELQWKDMLTKAKTANLLERTLSIVDVSGSMTGQPMEVAIAMGLFTALLADETDPFYKKIITFHENPTFHMITGNTLGDMVSQLQRAPWGMTTNFNKVFDMILDTGKKYNLTQEQMPQQVICYTDMQFDSADSRLEKTNFHVIKDKYTTAGYEIPRMIFWNLRASLSNAMPVTLDESGTAYLSGFSHNLLKGLMNGDINPLMIMLNVIKDYKVQIHPSDMV